jgi:hypothetical protein
LSTKPIPAPSNKEKYTVFASKENGIDGDAIVQLKHVADLPGMVHCFGMPDLHPGKGIPRNHANPLKSALLAIEGQNMEPSMSHARKLPNCPLYLPPFFGIIMHLRT